MRKTFRQSDSSSLIFVKHRTWARDLCTKHHKQVSSKSHHSFRRYHTENTQPIRQASFIKIPPFLQKISYGKHSANQIAAASLNMHGICRTSNLSEGLMYQVSQASFIKIPPFLFKISCGKRNGDRQTDGQGDYCRAPASRYGALIKERKIKLLSTLKLELNTKALNLHSNVDKCIYGTVSVHH
jgi:hypothetical protein